MISKITTLILTFIFSLSIVIVPSAVAASPTRPPSVGIAVHRHPVAVPIRVPAQWRTVGGQYPDKTDPTRLLSRADQLTFSCIRYNESRNHLVDGYGSQGWYQFTVSTWYAAAQALHLPPTPNQASGDQQSAAAIWYLKRNGRFGVQWASDASVCPGTFYF